MFTCSLASGQQLVARFFVRPIRAGNYFTTVILYSTVPPLPELLVNLKNRSGLTYSQIAKLDYFSDLSINSLGRLYHRFRKK